MRALQVPYPNVPAEDFLGGVRPKAHMHALYNESPRAALELTFTRKMRNTPYYREDTIFIHQSWMGTNGELHGGYSNLKRSDLDGRQYRIEFWDYAVGIYWLDCLLEPRGSKLVPLGTPPIDLD